MKLAAPRSPRVGDHAAELPLSVQMTKGRVYESVLYVQLERVVGAFVIAGTRPIALADSRRLATAAILHIDAALTPQPYRVPDVTGNAQVGETLTREHRDLEHDRVVQLPVAALRRDASELHRHRRRDLADVRRRPDRRQLPAAGGGDRGQPFRHGDSGFCADIESQPTARSRSTMSATKHTGAPWLRRGRFSG